MPTPDRKRPWAEPRKDTWRVRWPIPGRSPGSKSGFPTEADALQYGWEQIGEIGRGTWVDPNAASMTLAAWVNMWWPAQDLGRNTTNNYRWYIEAFILPEFGDRMLDTLTTLEITAWENGIKRDYALSTAASARSLLYTILGDAILAPNTNMKTNPAARPPRARGRRSGRRHRGRAGKKWATPLEVLLIAERVAVLSGRATDFVLVVTIGWTGMRWAEAIGMERQYLRHDDKAGIDFYELDYQIPEVSGRFLREPLKTDSYRTHDPDDGISRVDLPPFLTGLLQEVAGSHNGRCTCKGAGCGGKGLIFLGPNQGHFRRSNYSRRYWRPACDGVYPRDKKNGKMVEARPVLVDAADWPGRPLQAWPMTEPGRPFTPPSGRGWHPIPEDAHFASWLPVKAGIVPHGMRHGLNTWMEEDRIPRIMQRERMGHQEPGMGGRYTHVSSTMRVELVGALEERWVGALEDRREICPTSPVPVLQALLDGLKANEGGPR